MHNKMLTPRAWKILLYDVDKKSACFNSDAAFAGNLSGEGADGGDGGGGEQDGGLVEAEEEEKGTLMTETHTHEKYAHE